MSIKKSISSTKAVQDIRIVEDDPYLIDLIDQLQGFKSTQSQADYRSLVRNLAMMFFTFNKQNVKYGNSWRINGLGAKGMFAVITAKILRLKKLAWETPDSELEVGKTMETFRDSTVYHLLAMVLMDDQFGINEAAVQAEVDKT